MKTKVRLITIILTGVLIGVIAVKVQHGAIPIDDRLVSMDDVTRADALRSYAKKSDEQKEKIVDLLIQRHVKAQEPRERQYALYALRKSGFASPKIITPLIVGMQDGNPKVREEAETALAELGESAAPTLLQTLATQRSNRHLLIWAVSKSATPKTVPVILKSLKSSNPHEQRGAAGVLWGIQDADTKAAAKDALPILADMIKSTDTSSQMFGAFAMHNIAPDDTRPVPVFLRLIAQKDWDRHEVRGWQASEALARIKSPQSVPGIRRVMLNSDDGYKIDVRFPRPHLARQLESLDPRGRKVADLIWDLKNTDPAIRYRAAVIIGSTATVNPAYLRPLLDALDDRDVYVANRAYNALGKIEPSIVAQSGAVAFPKMLRALDRVSQVKIENFPYIACTALSRIGQPVLPHVVAAVKSGSIRLQTANAVLSFFDRNATPYLRALLSDRNADVRLVAAIALVRLAPATPGIESELEKGKNRPGEVGSAARAALAVLKESASAPK